MKQVTEKDKMCKHLVFSVVILGASIPAVAHSSFAGPYTPGTVKRLVALKPSFARGDDFDD